MKNKPNIQTPISITDGGTGTDLSATGGSGEFLKQESSGGPVTVGPLQNNDIPSGIDASKLGSGTVSNTEFDRLDGVTSSIQSQLNGKASSSHSHNLGSSSISGTLPVSKGGTGSPNAQGARNSLGVPSINSTYLYSIPLNPTSGAVVYRYTGNGQIHHLSSSKRNKKDIRKMESVTSKLKALRPVRFKGLQKAEESATETQEIEAFGLIAEEVHPLFPDLCYQIPEDESEGPSGIHYDRIVTYLLAGWQEQQARIEELEERLSILEPRSPKPK